MKDSHFDVLAPDKRDAARMALAAAFGSAAIDAITPLSGGASGAFIYRVDLRGRRYLLRIEGVPSPLRNPHQYGSLHIAAEAGLAPKILHVDEAARVMVTDFVEQRPLRDYPGGRAELAHALGELTARLQDTPVFPFFVTYPDIVERLFAHVRRTGLFADGVLAPHVERLAQISEHLDWPSTKLVSSHNDLNARNILFDGERLWLIDWESAYRNDPFVDVAILLDNLAVTPELESIFLHTWLGRVPDAALLERLAYIRALTRLYYAGVLLSASAVAHGAIADRDLGAPSLTQFEADIRAGNTASDHAATLHVMGKMYLASFLSGQPVPPLADV